MKKTLNDVEEFVKKAADYKGWILNTDDDWLHTLIEGLQRNINRYGYFACPCREAWGEQEADRDIICPCIYSDLDVPEFGRCYCNLFFRSGYFTEGNSAGPIPERRPEENIP
jgi:ferredoxin-thioredoxin reductase catalytic subunit